VDWNTLDEHQSECEGESEPGSFHVCSRVAVMEASVLNSLFSYLDFSLFSSKIQYVLIFNSLWLFSSSHILSSLSSHLAVAATLADVAKNSQLAVRPDEV
jgi:hypothetical protein